MIFCGYAFCGGPYSGDAAPVRTADWKNLTLSKGIYDDLFVTKSIVSTDREQISREWSFQTILHAAFEENLHAGNVDFTVSQVSCIRVKRRKKGDFAWTILFEVPVGKLEDLNFTRYDLLTKAKTEYEYALVAVLSGVEGNPNTSTVYSDFDGLCVFEKDFGYHTILETSVHPERCNLSSVIHTLSGKYPYVIHNSENSYDSGSASGLFVQPSDTCQWDFTHSIAYRRDLENFLSNHRPKFLKYQDGRAWIVDITDNVVSENGEHPEKVITTFSWVEIGDVDSSESLYLHDLSDVPPERW